MSVNANVCGNCANFKPKQGEKFFNCISAKQAGVNYAMQVRADTRSCEAFSQLNQPAKQPGAAQSKAPPPAKRTEPRRPGLCPWGRMVMLAALIIIILLLAFGAYTCFKGRGTTPAPTPTPAPTVPPTAAPTPTQLNTPTLTPTPVPIFEYNLGQWVTALPLLLSATSAEKVTTFSAPGPIVAPVGTSYIIISVTMTNGGSQSVFTKATDFTIVSKSGLSFPPLQPPFLFYNSYTWWGGWLDPGKTTSGRMLYVVPDAVSQLRIQTSANTNATVQWILPW